MGRTQDPTGFPVYKELNADPAATADRPENGRTFKDLVEKTGKTPRVVSYELKRLIEAGLVAKVEALDINGRDGRTKHIYVITKGWKWKETHMKIMDGVAAHASANRVYYMDATPHLIPGKDDVLVQLSLVVETPPKKKPEDYLPVTFDFDAMTNILKKIDHFLKKYPDQWHALLKRTVARIVTSQENNFFLIAYPKASFDSGKWPEPDWKNQRILWTSLPPPLSKRQRRFWADHGYVQEALTTVQELPGAARSVWESHVHGLNRPPEKYRRYPFAHYGHELPMRYGKRKHRRSISRRKGFLLKGATTGQ